MTSAVSFSPTDLKFELKPNQEECQKITIQSESEVITLSDKWADNKDQEWSVSGFKVDSSSHDVYIDYPSELSSDEREFDVCVSGEKLGEYHGVLLLKEEQVGNSIIQMGIWLKVIISETGKVAQTPVSATEVPQTTTSSGSGSSGGSVKATEMSDAELKAEEEALKKQQTQLSLKVNEVPETNEKDPGITGSAINDNDNSFGFNWDRILIGFIVVIAVVIAIAVFKRRNRGDYA